MKKPICIATMAMTMWHGASHAQEAPDWRLPTLGPATIEWAPCAPPLVREGALQLGERLRCGSMTVPLDHHHPEAGSIQVALIRVAASDPANRQGTVFFNPGGPGDTAMDYLPALAQYWDDAYADHPVHGTKKYLAERFDLVGVIPRGLEGGTAFTCGSDEEATDYNDPIADRSAANVGTMQRYMRATADACLANPLHRFINTEQTVYDMEVARRSLGESKLNYLGYSYGAWLGSWYASSFPERVGRMVLDSSMDWTVDWNTNIVRSKAASQAAFDRLVGEPAANDSARYGLGADVAAVTAQIGGLAFPVRYAWGGEWTAPESLLAAKAVSEWLRVDPDMSLETLIAHMQAYRFHADDAVDKTARDEAIRSSTRLFPATYEAEPLRLDARHSVFSAVMCNDMPYPGNAVHHQARITSLARSAPAANGDGLQYHCVYWGGPQATRPPLSRMGAAGDILMVHAEYDPITPLDGASAAFAATPTARLLIAGGLGEHGIFGFTDSACIEDTVGRYLLSGILPAGRERRCEAIPASHDGPGRGFTRPGHAAALRSELVGMHSPFVR